MGPVMPNLTQRKVGGCWQVAGRQQLKECEQQILAALPLLRCTQSYIVFRVFFPVLFTPAGAGVRAAVPGRAAAAGDVRKVVHAPGHRQVLYFQNHT